MRHGTTSARFRRTHQPGTAGEAAEIEFDPADPACQVRQAPVQAIARSVAARDRPARCGGERVDRNHYEAMLAYFPTRFRPQYNLQRRFDPAYNDLWAPSTWAGLLEDDPVSR